LINVITLNQIPLNIPLKTEELKKNPSSAIAPALLYRALPCARNLPLQKGGIKRKTPPDRRLKKG